MGYFSLYDLREGIGLDRNDGHKDSILYSLGKKADSAVGNDTNASNVYALMLYFAGPGDDPKKAAFYKSLIADSITDTTGLAKTTGNINKLDG